MHEWAYSGENVVNLCATSRTTTMGELRIAVGEMRNEYHISSALLPAISTLDSCYLLLHLQVLFAAAVVVVLVGLLIVVLLSLQDTPVDGCPTRNCPSCNWTQKEMSPSRFITLPLSLSLSLFHTYCRQINWIALWAQRAQFHFDMSQNNFLFHK